MSNIEEKGVLESKTAENNEQKEHKLPSTFVIHYSIFDILFLTFILDP